MKMMGAQKRRASASLMFSLCSANGSPVDQSCRMPSRSYALRTRAQPLPSDLPIDLLVRSIALARGPVSPGNSW
ncbi:hypothetical protein GY45DRAFT_1328654 [Cubamyces sp. BRFM 1775]|nr:hypothetical protein GY45DRAFT_1328654 [Cubamyces sp. BRFM 1775]